MTVLVAGPLLHLGVAAVGGVLTLLTVLAFATELVPVRAAGGPLATDHHEDPHVGSTGLDHRKVAIWVSIGSECLFFGTLISPTWSTAGGASRTIPTTFSTFR